MRLRADSRGVSLDHLVGIPQPKEDHWFRLHWLALPFVQEQALEQQGRVRAWHGSKLEALYSIAYHGALFAREAEHRGERFLAGAPGVYLHVDATMEKA